MPRVVHFELAVDDPKRASAFYQNVFGWKVSQWSDQDYWLVGTGEDSERGIDGALTPRQENMPPVVNTIDVQSLDDSLAAILANGGQTAMPKMTVPGVGYLAYCTDTEGNLFGMMESDPNAQP